MDGNYSIDDLYKLVQNIERRIKKLETIQRPEEYQEIDIKNYDAMPAPKTRSQIRSMLEMESRKKNA